MDPRELAPPGAAWGVVAPPPAAAGRRRRLLPAACSSRLSSSAPACRGRNLEGQCGVQAYLPLLLQAREVEALAGLPVAELSAAKTHSAAVLPNGDVLTWGEGSDGKLGHGCTGGCC